VVPAKPKRYRPDPIRPFSVPKPRGGGWRRLAILSRRDDRSWHALAGRLARLVEPRLDCRVVANRVIGASGAWRLETVEAALRRARAVAPRGTTLLHTDVEEFYASITSPVLMRTLGGISASERDLRLAGTMLDGWASQGHAGLPIGPAGSAVLANAVLMSVDRALSSFRFVRWVDDYVIELPAEAAADRILERFDESLARLGLRRSLPKTRIVEGPGGIAWLRTVSAARPP
jgi:hypothetical protein